MKHLLEHGLAWLRQQRHTHLTVPVRYTRGVASVALRATVGKTVFEVDSGYGVLERLEARDYLLRREDLVLEGQEALPERGDRIIEDGHIYEVMAPGKEPHWRWSDAFRRTLRVHTKYIGTS